MGSGAATNNDAGLDSVLGTIQNIRHQAVTIGEELDEQAILLDQIGKKIDHTDAKLQSATERVARFYKLATDKRYNLTVGILVAVLVVLLLVLLVL